jgi:pyocin large subunit-like protein
MTAKTGKTEGKKASQNTEDKKQKQSGQDESTTQSSSSKTSDEEMDMGGELDDLLNLLEEEDLTDIDLEQAADMIEEWQSVLSKSKDVELKEIGSNLKKLKKSVGSSKVKEAEIAEILSELGSQVDAFANNAQRGYKTKLHRLGKALSGESKEIMSEQGDE